jgi:hypothetical protein
LFDFSVFGGGGLSTPSHRSSFFGQVVFSARPDVLLRLLLCLAWIIRRPTFSELSASLQVFPDPLARAWIFLMKHSREFVLAASAHPVASGSRLT